MASINNGWSLFLCDHAGFRQGTASSRAVTAAKINKALAAEGHALEVPHSLISYRYSTKSPRACCSSPGESSLPLWLRRNGPRGYRSRSARLDNSHTGSFVEGTF